MIGTLTAEEREALLALDYGYDTHPEDAVMIRKALRIIDEQAAALAAKPLLVLDTDEDWAQAGRRSLEQAVLGAAASMTVDRNGLGWTRKQLEALIDAIAAWKAAK